MGSASLEAEAVRRNGGDQKWREPGCFTLKKVDAGLVSTPSTAVSVRSERLPSPALRGFAWGVLAYFVAVILWGTLVRATGSGAGCGDHWPLCNGTVIQHSPRTATIIEFTHRLTSAISFFSVVALLIWTFAATVKGHVARVAVMAAVLFTLVEAAIGALLVELGLTAESRSPLRAPYLALHLTNTLLLVAALTMTAHMLGRREGYLRGKIRLAGPWGALAALLAFLIVGVTGSLAALGDTLFPAHSLESALAQDFSTRSAWLLRWRWTHPTLAFLACVFLIWLVVRATKQRTPWDNRGLSVLVLALLAAQYVLGVLDVVWLAPVWLQILHLLGADALWAALVVLAARLTLEPMS